MFKHFQIRNRQQARDLNRLYRAMKKQFKADGLVLKRYEFNELLITHVLKTPTVQDIIEGLKAKGFLKPDKRIAEDIFFPEEVQPDSEE